MLESCRRAGLISIIVCNQHAIAMNDGGNPALSGPALAGIKIETLFDATHNLLRLPRHVEVEGRISGFTHGGVACRRIIGDRPPLVSEIGATNLLRSATFVSQPTNSGAGTVRLRVMAAVPSTPFVRGSSE